jgi:AraC-like DNA-binding protein
MATNAARMRLHEWANLRAHLIWIYEDSPGMPHGTAPTEGAGAWLLRQGHVTVTGKTRTVQAQAGQWVFQPFEKCSRDFSADARILSINCLASWPDGRKLFDEPEPLVFDRADFPKLERTARPLLRVVEKQFPKIGTLLPLEFSDLPFFLKIERLLADWLVAYVETMLALGGTQTRMSGLDHRVVEARRRLDLHPLSRAFDERELAVSLSLSQRQLDRLFVAEFGLTPRAAFDHRRIEHAQHRLRTSARAIKEIAYELGFSQPSHFAKWFRRQTGQYPSDYRQESARS